jgi:hypothetical protein
MNERIKELLNEAEKSVTFLSNSNESKHQIAMQRFAELIVRECVSKIEEAAEYSPELYGVALDLL